MQRLNAAPPLLTVLGLVPFGAWWFAQALLLERSAGPAFGEFSASVLRAAVVAQVLALCLFLPGWLAEAPTAARSVASRGALILLPAVIPAWPLIAVLGLASGAGVVALVFTQLAVILAGTIATFASGVLRRSSSASQALARRCLGAILAAAAWYSRDLWLAGLAP